MKNTKNYENKKFTHKDLREVWRLVQRSLQKVIAFQIRIFGKLYLDLRVWVREATFRS
jgi:hypothetical protein